MKKRVLMVSVILTIALFAGCKEKTGSETETTPSTGTSASIEKSETEGEAPAENKKVKPCPSAISMQQLDNSTIAVAFSSKDITEETDGTVRIHFEVYDYETFAATDIEALQDGDTLVIDGQEISVKSVEEEDGTVRINGGTDNGGINLVKDTDGTYYENLSDTADVVPSYYLVGDTTMDTDPAFVCEDSADLDLGEQTYTAGELKEKEDFQCMALDSTMSIKNGKISKVIRSYRP